jgi:hypothetical protein
MVSAMSALGRTSLVARTADRDPIVASARYAWCAIEVVREKSIESELSINTLAGTPAIPHLIKIDNCSQERFWKLQQEYPNIARKMS